MGAVMHFTNLYCFFFLNIKRKLKKVQNNTSRERERRFLHISLVQKKARANVQNVERARHQNVQYIQLPTEFNVKSELHFTSTCYRRCHLHVERVCSKWQSRLHVCLRNANVAETFFYLSHSTYSAFNDNCLLSVAATVAIL